MWIFGIGREHLILREEAKLEKPQKPRRLFNPNALEWEEKKAEFQELRKNNWIGGSRAPGIMARLDDTVEYGSPLQAYCRMKRISKPPKSDGISAGKILEPIIRKNIAKFLASYSDNVKIRSDPFMYQSREYPHMIGQVDGFVTMDRHRGERGGVEIKYSGEFQRPKWAGGKIPSHVLYQVVHYMAVFPVDYFLIVIFTPTSWDYKFNYRIVTRKKLQDKIDWVIQEEIRFRENHLVPEVMPYPIGVKADYDVLEEVMGIGIYEDGHEIDDETMEAIKNYQEAGMAIKGMEKQKLAFKNLIYASLEGHKTGLYKGKPVCKVTKINQRRVDNNRLKDDGLYEKYLKETSFLRFDVIKR
jgi:predicted phage-related endonuclease